MSTPPPVTFRAVGSAEVKLEVSAGQLRIAPAPPAGSGNEAGENEKEDDA